MSILASFSSCLLCMFLLHGAYSSDYFVLHNPASGLVLDVIDEKNVTVQRLTGADSQQWKLEPTRSGLNYIVHKNTGKVLAVEDTDVVVGSKISKTPKKMTCQQWFINSDGTIANGCSKDGLDIPKSSYVAGTQVIVYDPIPPTDNQIWNFVYT